MAPPKRPWFRVYTEAMQDRKLRRLPPAQRWVWIAVLSLSCQSPQRGRLLLAPDEPATIDDVADEAAVPKPQASKAMASFERLGMVATDDADVWTVPRWDDRQYESDNSTTRVQRHRNARGNADETLHRSGMERSPLRAPATEAEAEAETEAEQDQERGRTRRKRRSTPMPDDWHPTTSHREKASKLGVDTDAEAEAFRDHHLARDSRFANWDRAFHTWLTNTQKFGANSGPNNARNGQAPRAGPNAVSDFGPASETGPFTP